MIERELKINSQVQQIHLMNGKAQAMLRNPKSPILPQCNQLLFY